MDLLTSHLVSSVSFATNQEPNGVTSHSGFISDSPIGDDFGLLAPVASRNGFSVTGTQFTFAFSPTSGRYLEIVANGGPSWTSIGRVNAVPVPAALWLFGSTIAGLGMLRRKFA